MAIKLHEGTALKRDRQHERAVRSSQVLESFASGFTLRPISVKLVQGSPAPAFSSSNRIWFDESQLADLTTAMGVTSLKGLTIHEIAHILLTPRSGSDFMQWLLDNPQYKHAWNALEDQRIESALLASYPSVRPWLEATMNEYLLKTAEHLTVAFPLIHGRRYLSPEARALARKLYIKQEDTADLARIIDAFRVLNLSDPKDIDTACELIIEYHALTKGIRLPNPNGHENRATNEHETNAKSRSWSKKKQQEAMDKVKEEDDDTDDIDIDSLWEDYLDDEDEPEESESGDSGDEGDSDDWDGADGSDWDAEDEDDSDEWDGADGSDFDSEDSAEQDTDGESEEADGGSEPDDKSASREGEANTNNGGGGSSATPEQEAMTEALKDLLKQTLDETLESLADKIANDIALYNGDVLLEGEEMPEPERYSRELTQSVSPAMASASDEFGFALQQLRAEQAPAWLRRVGSGRINPARWESGCDYSEAFDRWEEGHEDATDIECVVLLDVSGSMNGMITGAHESMWAIKHALDQIQASTTVVAYSDGNYASFLLYSANEQVESEMRVVPDLSGTDPHKSLQYAKYLLSKSTRAIKMLVIITDGEWNGKVTESDEIISDIRNGGVITALAYLDQWGGSRAINGHGCEIVSKVSNPSDLFPLGQAIVEVGIARQLAH